LFTLAQVGTFRLFSPGEQEKRRASLETVACSSQPESALDCNKLRSHCGWCQLRTQGSCYDADVSTIAACRALGGTWHGKVRAGGVPDNASPAELSKFVSTQLQQTQRRSNRTETFVPGDTEHKSPDMLWTISRDHYYEWRNFSRHWYSPVFEKSHQFW
jgi:hypothetical protein